MIDMASQLEARVSELEDHHADQHQHPYVFDDITLVPCDLQQVLASRKIANMVGQIDSRSKTRPGADTDDCSPPGDCVTISLPH